MTTTITRDQKREQFNTIINNINMILMNNIVEVDCESLFDNWLEKSPESEGDIEDVYQWFAIGQFDAQFLARYGQYVTYSALLDTHFLAITHFGTSWDDVDSMVDAFDDLYTEMN